MAINNFERYLDIFDGMEPYSEYVDRGFSIDFVGQRTDAKFWTTLDRDPQLVGGCNAQTTLPKLADGEEWFEYFNWVAAAREARGSYVMMTLGSCFGLQVVGSYLTLQALNPLPAMLVAVDGVPENIEMTRQHFRNNGIDPEEHWLVEAALSGDNKPVLFPVGSPGSGAQNCTETNSEAARMAILELARRNGNVEHLAQNLLLRNSTDLTIDLVPNSDCGFTGEIAFVSRPKLKFPVKLERIDPVAVTEEEGNIFLVRATFSEEISGWWRPGMSGMAKINVGKRNLLWIFTHRTIDFLRIFFWW